MGSVFAEEILDVPNPEVRLLSIGEEPEKGNQLTLEAHELLAASDLNFKGNTEGRDILAGASDVVVTDGFTGNVTLKLLEGTILTLLDALRSEITATTRGKLGGLLIRPAARRLRHRLDPDTFGGAYLLGLRGLVGDRARQFLPHGDRQRDPPRGPRRGARRRRAARCTAAPAHRGCMIGALIAPNAMR